MDSGRRLPPPPRASSHVSSGRANERHASPHTVQQPETPRSPHFIPPGALQEAQEELREVMIQYSNCADPPSDSRLSALARLGPSPPPATRPPVLERLQPPPQETGEPVTTTGPSMKKRLGRPPGSKNQSTLALGAAGTITKKRRVTLSKGSPKRRTPSARAPKPAQKYQDASASASMRPSCNIIPPVARRSVDFRAPPPPIP